MLRSERCPVHHSGRVSKWQIPVKPKYIWSNRVNIFLLLTWAIIDLTVSQFDVWRGTTVSCIKTLMQWELGRSEPMSCAKHYTGEQSRPRRAVSFSPYPQLWFHGDWPGGQWTVPSASSQLLWTRVTQLQILLALKELTTSFYAIFYVNSRCFLASRCFLRNICSWENF